MSNLVSFYSGTLAAYTALTTKDPNTLYFVSDERRIYKGDQPYGGGIYKAVTTYPEDANAEINTIYVNTTDGSAKFYNGSIYVTLVKPQVNSITGSGSTTELASTKAIVDYVAGAVNNLPDITSRLDSLETFQATVEGTGEGSLSKTLQDAKDYADSAVSTLASGAVATNAANITTLTNDKADKATTLAGYGIADAYTKTQTDTAIASAISDAGHLVKEIVESLPAVEDAVENVIYMVPKTNGSGNQVYDEFMLINNALEKIGDTEVDLTNYATSSYVDTQVSAAITTAASDATTKSSQALADAKDYADGLASNYATAAQGALADSALQKDDITTGTANGTISVDGSNVAVFGLGSAAYTEASAYATSAQGALAATALQPSSITTGVAAGTIAVNGSDVSVAGLGSAAFTEASAYDVSGAATSALNSAKEYAESLLTWKTL